MQRTRLRFNRLSEPRSQTALVAHRANAIHSMAGPLASEGQQTRPRPRDFSPRQWLIYLLHEAAEIEHALMVQYLYAMFSLNDNASGPSAADPATTVTASDWGSIIRGIAVEEMGHLLTVQNALRFVGGPMSFARGDFPLPTEVYPFPFELEALTKDVLAKYVYAEMPAGDIDPAFSPPEEIDEIKTRAQAASGGSGGFSNHVGILYASILDTLQDPVFADPAKNGFPKDSEPFEAVFNVGWSRLQGNQSIATQPVKLKGARLLTITSLPELVAALDFIARQGEASDTTSLRQSHFGRFLDIYRAFPDSGAAGWNTPPSQPVASNPFTAPQPNTTTITNPETLLWARLFDLRYRMLLALLAHTTAIPRVANPGDTVASPAVKALVARIFQVMSQASLNIGDLGRALTQMPLGDPQAPARAGAPFTVPYSLDVPDRDQERWQWHLDLLDCATGLIADLRGLPPDPSFPDPSTLDSLTQDDDVWRGIVQGFL